MKRATHLSWGEREREIENENGGLVSLQGHSPSDLTSTRSHLLKVLSPPNSTTGWRPSLQHMGLWETSNTKGLYNATRK
jgi:hypothetical protein